MKQRKKQPVQTRQAILDAAAAEFSAYGYAGSGLGGIVVKAQLTKGALFHHFPDKRALAVAWIEGDLASAIGVLWIAPLETAASLDALQALCRTRCLELEPQDAVSALVSLTAETAAADPVLGAALGGVFASWRTAMAGCLERGKVEGWIHPSIKPGVEAAFLVSAFAGYSVTLKCNPDEEARRACATAMEGYLETLRTQ